MTAFSDALDADKKNNFFNNEEFAEQITYTPLSGSAYQLNALFDNEFESVDPDTNQPVISTQPMIRVDTNDLQSTIKKGDKVTVRTIVYKIITDEPDGVGTVVLRLHKDV